MHGTVIFWPTPDPIQEAGEDGPARRAQRANRAAQDVIRDYQQMEQGTVDQLATRLATLKQSLLNRLAGENLTDFKAMTLNRLLSDVDQLIADTGVKVIGDTEKPYAKANELGDQAATEPMKAAQLSISKALPGLDSVLVQAAFGNTVDLLTAPMQQFASQVKTGIRRVALAGDNKFEEIQRLTGLIKGQGMDAAQYKAERIIRTELGRVFNQSTFEKLSALAKDFPFLGKGWRATKDRRTRLGHVQAGRDYARGRGIPMAALFKVNVYDERDKKKAPVLIGVASLRFPSDPQTTPAGKVAAGATIMCRCNAFVDVDVAKFAAFTKAKVATAMGGAVPPPTPPGPVTPPVTVPVAPRKPKVPRVAKPKPGPAPKAQVPNLPMQAERTQAVRTVPAGTKVSTKLAIPSGRKWDVAREAMAALDDVHGDGPLSPIPLMPSAATGNYGTYWYKYGRGGYKIQLSQRGLADHPRMTLWHETGHWLDNMVVNKGTAVHPGMETIRVFNRRKRTIEEQQVPAKAPGRTSPDVGSIATYSSTDRQAKMMDEWRQTAEKSEAIQEMKRWQSDRFDPKLAKATDKPGQPGHGYAVRPPWTDSKHLNYLLTGEEIWARSYAQYVAIRSGSPAGLAELRKLQADAIGTKTPNINETGSVAYKRQWQDEDFEPIAKAFDKLFEQMGWRIPGKGV